MLDIKLFWFYVFKIPTREVQRARRMNKSKKQRWGIWGTTRKFWMPGIIRKTLAKIPNSREIEPEDTTSST